MEFWSARDMAESGLDIVFNVAVDLRSSSPTYGKWHAKVLTEEKKAVPDSPRIRAWFSCSVGYRRILLQV